MELGVNYTEVKGENGEMEEDYRKRRELRTEPREDLSQGVEGVEEPEVEKQRVGCVRASSGQHMLLPFSKSQEHIMTDTCIIIFHGYTLILILVHISGATADSDFVIGVVKQGRTTR